MIIYVNAASISETSFQTFPLKSEENLILAIQTAAKLWPLRNTGRLKPKDYFVRA